MSCCSDPRAALVKAEAEASNLFDLVISGWDMPGMSGDDLARALRKRQPALPIVVASGTVDTRLLEQTLHSVTWAVAKDVLVEGLDDLYRQC